MEVTVKVPKLHPAQREILSNAKRFNHLRCGRRFGKTTLITELCLIALDGDRVGVWFPTYKDLSEIWKEVRFAYRQATSKVNEQLKQITLISGGLIDFWSMDDPDSGQGRKYHRAIIDEAAKAKHLHKAWEETIRPTLADYRGDAWIMSRPKGYNPFWKIGDENKDFDNWAYHHYTTYDNPYIDKDEIEEQKEQLSPVVFEQEFMAEYVDINSMPFFFDFKRESFIQDCPIDDTLPLRLSFDFNLDPFATIVYQRDGNDLNMIDCIKLNDGDIEQVCDEIIGRYGKLPFIVTGDKSGNNRSGMSRGKLNYWQVIKRRLDLKPSQIRLRSKNLDLVSSRILCNLVHSHTRIGIKMDPKCKDLIRDCETAQVDDHGILVKDRNKQKNDFLDAYRYILDAEFPDIVTKPDKY